MMDKRELRAQMRAMRRSLSVSEQETASRGVYARLLAFEPYVRAACIMAYDACRGELSLAPVLEDVLAGGKTLLLPRCEAPGVMTARRITDFSQLVSGAYGLREPDETCEIVLPHEIDLVLVPGTAFDREGNRLGQGGGYYDRFLAQTKALRVGICHGRALHACVPHDVHDERMDAVITPDEIVEPRSNRRK